VGQRQPGDAYFQYLSGAAVDPTTGIVYVADRNADCIKSFRLIDGGPKGRTGGPRLSFAFGKAAHRQRHCSQRRSEKPGGTP
jgi:hypothetical protein